MESSEGITRQEVGTVAGGNRCGGSLELNPGWTLSLRDDFISPADGRDPRLCVPLPCAHTKRSSAVPWRGHGRRDVDRGGTCVSMAVPSERRRSACDSRGSLL
ncbi:unnamed protein product [Gadus morhua 'NCC']